MHEIPAFAVGKKSDEEASVYLHVQHACSVQAVYKVEEYLIDVRDNRYTEETDFELTSKRMLVTAQLEEERRKSIYILNNRTRPSAAVGDEGHEGYET